MNVTIIGTGNVAQVLGRVIREAGHHISQVVGRNTEQAQTLSERLQAPGSGNISQLKPGADIYIIAVTDFALEQIEEWMPFIESGIVLHTAGSVSMAVLKNIARNYGVLYPLQSLQSRRNEAPVIPVLVDGNSETTVQIIQKFASTFSKLVSFADDEQRTKIHLAAVILNNFNNYLAVLTQDYCNKEKIDFHLLQPLLSETVNRLAYHTAEQMQTGPARRNDTETMTKHIAVLKNYPALQHLYIEFSNSITRFYHVVTPP